MSSGRVCDLRLDGAIAGLRFTGRRAMVGAVGAFQDLEEVMRFDPVEGIADLDAHLAKLKAAADALGFRFDRHDARNELQAATFGKTRPATARLLLSPSGAMAIEVTPD